MNIARNTPEDYYSLPMVFSKKNAGKWVASKDGKVLAVGAKLSSVLQKVKGHKKESLRLDLVPKTPYLAGSHAF